MVKKTRGLVAAAALTIGGVLGVSFYGHKPIDVPAYRAIRVIDGDTFETEEKQHIRLASIDAPELSLCGGEEAKKELEKLVFKQDIYLKIIYHESNGRQIAIVYTKDGLVAEKMLAVGWAEIHDREGTGEPELTAATQKARAEKLGVFSEQCTQVVNPDKPNCLIKANVKQSGNINLNLSDNSYYLPECNFYDTVKVQLHHGDQWFCTEAEAKKAGFVKAGRCPQ